MWTQMPISRNMSWISCHASMSGQAIQLINILNTQTVYRLVDTNKNWIILQIAYIKIIEKYILYIPIHPSISLNIKHRIQRLQGFPIPSPALGVWARNAQIREVQAFGSIRRQTLNSSCWEKNDISLDASNGSKFNRWAKGCVKGYFLPWTPKAYIFRGFYGK